MFGDDTTQTNVATDATVNPALPPSDIGDPLGGSTSTDNMTGFPAPPVSDDTTTSPVVDDAVTSDMPTDMPSDAPVVESAQDAPVPVPETDPTLGQDLAAAAPAALLDDSSADQTDETSSDSSDSSTDTSLDSPSDDASQDITDVTTLGVGADSAVAAGSEELIDIKQEALEQLSPLVDKLDQSPEERFRTTMMMIQASDNQALVKKAFDAAQAITDDKARAQALLDVINEINYFTTQAKS